MSTYARLWSAGAIAMAAMALTAVVLAHGLALAWIALGFTVSIGACVRWGRLDRPAPDLPGARETAAAIGIAVVGSLGFGLLVGLPGFLVPPVLAVLCPRALHAWTARRPRRTPEATSRAEEAAPAEPGAGWTSQLTNRELCDGWCVSYLALHAATSAEQKLRIVLTRRDYLDEFEARNRPAFDRWLASEPRGSSSPARLLAEPRAAPADDDGP